MLHDRIELIAVIAFLIIVVLFRASIPLRERLAMRKMRHSNYVVFEADPLHLDDLTLDMSRAGWKLASSSRTAGSNSLFRFEKAKPGAPSFGKFEMIQTANRERGADLIIRIAGHGLV